MLAVDSVANESVLQILKKLKVLIQDLANEIIVKRAKNYLSNKDEENIKDYQ